jgi:effector-binding domain-containing protein
MKPPMHPRFAAALLSLPLFGCTSQPVPLSVQLTASAANVPVHTAFNVDWKERLDQPYVFLELIGDYGEARRQLATLAQHAAAQGVAPNGPPFALFFDDPLRVPPEARRSRVAWPVAATCTVAPPLGFDVLPSEPVVYGFVRGAYRELERAYPDLFGYLRERSWVLTGPVREIYHLDPGAVRGPDELVAELQMPWRPL